jgi:hypothetical protein
MRSDKRLTNIYTHLLHAVYRNISVTAEFLIIGIIYVGSSAEYKLPLATFSLLAMKA